MSARSVAAPGTAQRQDRGFTLIEVLVAISLFSVVGTLLLSFALSTADVTRDVSNNTDLTGESRLAVERMGRELRQARAVDAVQFQSASATTTAITFWTDFNGNGTRDLSSSDPEVLTYRWDPAAERLTLTANDAGGTAVTRPVLAGTVTSFTLELRSSLWQYDADANGITDWTELDAAGAPVGNGNGRPDAPELAHIDLVAVTMVVSADGTQQTFTMQADLRNMAQN